MTRQPVMSDDNDGSGGTEIDLRIPVQRIPTEFRSMVYVAGVLFIGMLVVGFLETAGFDRCDLTHPPPSPTAQFAQRVVAACSVVLALGLSIVRLRRWWLVVALLGVGVVGAGWLVLLSGGQNC